MIQLLDRSGGLSGFGSLVSRHARGQKKVMILAWLMSVILFVDEYLNSVTVTFSMRSITDQNRIPREHLAIQAHAMACCLCAAIPFTSWIGFSVSLLKKYDLGFSDYLQAVPLMFYPVLLIFIMLLLAAGLLPKAGNLKKAYQRVDEGGPTLPEEDSGNLAEIGTAEGPEQGNPVNALLPIAALVAGVLLFDNDLIHGLVLALVCQFVLYVPQRILKVSEFFETFLEGAKGMTSISIIIFLGFMLSKANRDLGFFDIVIGGASSSISPAFLPVLAFLLVAFCVFAMDALYNDRHVHPV